MQNYNIVALPGYLWDSRKIAGIILVIFSLMALIEFTKKGLYCPEGGFYIDPWLPVEKAIITHAHSDHAKAGHLNYLCHPYTKSILEARLGVHTIETLEWESPLTINGVTVSLHPAGHIIGSSQVRIERNGEVWVFSGDYKTSDDGISGVFQPVKCDVFITESTFGLPIYQWKPQEQLYNEIDQWIRQNQEEERCSILIAYSLGKAQRVIEAAARITDNIFLHGATWNMQQALINSGHDLFPAKRVMPDMPKSSFKNAVIVAPPGAEGSPWLKRFSPYSIGICSGWMQVRGNARRKNADRGFVISDHADWDGLLSAVKETGATKVFVTHGFQAAFSRYLIESGIESAEIKTEYGNDEEGEPSVADEKINEE